MSTDQSPPLGRGVTLEDVLEVSAEGSGLVVHYRTRASLRDCSAQALEMPRVWVLAVEGRLKDSNVTRVSLFPEEAAGASAATTFTKDERGRWSASAPCAVSIPTDVSISSPLR
jgi:hypothetical protein